MSDRELDDLVAAVIQRKPRFRSSIERMFHATRAQGDRNVDAAFRKYLKKIADAPENEAADFVAEMEKYALAAEQVRTTLETMDQSGDYDPAEILYNQFPQARKIVLGILFGFICLAGIVFYLAWNG